MMEKAFLDHFKISADEVQSLQSESTNVLPLLELLIEKHKIEPSQYLEWAKNHYGLPILKESFFEEHNQVEQLLSRYRNVFPRNVVPFYEWDGVLYVMCLEPVVFDAPQKIQYILAPLTLIHKWSPPAPMKSGETQVTKVFQLSDEVAPKIPDASSIEAAEPVASSEDELNIDVEENTKHFEKLSSIDFGNISIPSAGGSSHTAPQSIPSTPVPAQASAPSTSKPFDPTSLLEKDEPDATPFAIETIEAIEEQPAAEINVEKDEDGMPEGLSFPPPPSEEQPDYVVHKSITATDLTEVKKQVPAEETNKNRDAAPLRPSPFAPAQAQATVPPPVPMPTPMPTPVAPVATTAPAAPLKKVEVVQAQDEMESTHTGIIISTDGAIGIINKLKRYFDQTMILNYENGVLKPLKWDGSWAKSTHTQKAIDLKLASIFRIVHDTKTPYHGQVFPNPINDAFFQAWNKGLYPQHITICPIIENKQIVGMILGACSSLASQKFQLRHIEAIADDCLESVIKPQRSNAAA